MKKIIFLLALSLLLAGCGYMNKMTKGVAGSGVRKGEKRDVAPFTSVDVSGAFEVEIVAGKDRSLELEGDDNILPMVTTEVSNGKLRVSNQTSFSVKRPVHVRITTPDIEELSASGANDVTLSEVKNEKLRIETSGASKIRAAGETKTLDVQMSGASNVDTLDLRAQKVTVDSSGAGHASVYASEELNAEASGASSITYTGDPKVVNRKDSGASSISKK